MSHRDIPLHDSLPRNHAYLPFDDEQVVPRQHTRRQRRNGWWLKPLLILAAMVLGAMAAGSFWVHQVYADRVYPYVLLQGVAIGGQTQEQAQQTVEQAYGSFLEAPLTLRHGDQAWQPSLADLGISVDWERSYQKAFAVGHSGRFFADIGQLLGITSQPSDVPLHMVVDGGQLHDYLGQIAAQIEEPPQEATIALNNGVIETTPSVEGREVLLEETAEAIVGVLRQLQPQEITIQTQQVAPQITTERVAEVQQDIETMIGAPLELTVEDRSFTLGLETLSQFVVIERVEQEGAATLQAQLDPAKLETFLRQITAEVGESPVEPRVRWNDGVLEIFQEGASGYGVDIAQSVELINDAIHTTSRQIDLPMGEVLPQVNAETLDQLGITELVAEGKSQFTGSAPYRVNNIKAGVALLDGILIPPDGAFSFNNTVGDLSPEKGFTQGYAIVGTRSQLEFGGGICQVSTTLFRGAFYAGLPITERAAHSYRIDWYEMGETVGMDAAIFTGTGPDLRFVNDTGNWILIQASVNEETSSVSIGLYGTQVEGRTVERSEPVISNERPAPSAPVYIDDPQVPVGTFKQTDHARGGVDVVVTRTVMQDGEVVRSEDFISNFQPWPNIYLKNPATPAPVLPPSN